MELKVSWKSTAEEVTTYRRTLVRPHCEGFGEALEYLKKNITKTKSVDSNTGSFFFISQKGIVKGKFLFTSMFLLNNETNPGKYHGQIRKYCIP